VSERVAIAEAVAERLGKRQGGDRKTDQSGNISTLIDHGKTRDLAAAKAGLGSGKTLVAAAAIWFAAQNGWQSAMLAPTEILARQHAANLADRLEPFGVNVTLLVGGMKAAEKRVALAAIADGRAGLVVGTHAVLTDSVVFKNLGLAIVDEQHRFGVRQRGILAGKANNPHLLVMSATPIPRTLGLLMYGDLDISILDELPPGRKPIKTWFITGKKRRDMYGFLEKQIAAGHQVYIVCPAIEENEMDSDMKAVKQYYEQVACPLLPGRRIGLLHGKMKPKDKDEVMQQFKAGELDVLVSTTVIEVGVDVPNATVMVIENAERFGLSALHQLRGRVGRGAANSCCILISDNEGEAVRQRLHFLCRTSDGFAVAKYDLETRGPGDFFGEARPAHPACGGPCAGYPHPDRCPAGSQSPAGPGPQPGQTGAQSPFGRSGAPVCHSRGHELVLTSLFPIKNCPNYF
jgi:ATP-dependent DNA helicase RecG